MPDLATSIPKNAANFSLGRLVWRFLSEHRLRALLSGLAVSFGVAIILTADLVGASLLEALLNADIEGAEITHSFVSEQFDMMISIVGYVLIAAAGFVVFNAFTMTISQRQQQIGVLRALGMTRRQMMRLVLAEGLILALLGVAAGLLLGWLMGYGLIAMLELFAGHILFFASTPAVSGTAVLQAIILGIGVTLLSIWWPPAAPARCRHWWRCNRPSCKLGLIRAKNRKNGWAGWGWGCWWERPFSFCWRFPATGLMPPPTPSSRWG